MPNSPFSSRCATTDHCLFTDHSTLTTWGFAFVTSVMYVKVMLGVTCCSSVSRACGVYCTPPASAGSSVGLIRRLLIPKKRC